eukprot:5951401-Lingulodinium_polyedra.AAC.1
MKTTSHSLGQRGHGGNCPGGAGPGCGGQLPEARGLREEVPPTFRDTWSGAEAARTRLKPPP